MYKNNSKDKPYYTQRNNHIKPGTSCNVTSMIAGLSAAGYPVDSLVPEGVQPEDSLLCYIMTDAACSRLWRRLDPSGKIPPNEWHDVLAYGCNRWLGAHGIKCNPVTFTQARITDVRNMIDAGGAAVVSGVFETETGKINHIVCVVGYDGDDLIIDDPWGDFRDKYKTQQGNDIPLTAAQWSEMLKPVNQGKKWAHLIAPYKKKEENIEGDAA